MHKILTASLRHEDASRLPELAWARAESRTAHILHFAISIAPIYGDSGTQGAEGGRHGVDAQGEKKHIRFG